MDTGIAGLAEASLLAFRVAYLAGRRTLLPTPTATFRIELIVIAAFMVVMVVVLALVLLLTSAVDSRISGLAEAPLLAPVTAFSARLSACLLTATAAFGEEFIVAMALVTFVSWHALPMDANVAVLAETSFRASPRAFVPVRIAFLVAVLAAFLKLLVLSALFLALPAGHTLAANSHVAVLAEAPLLAGLGAVLLLRIASLVTGPAALFKFLVVVALLLLLAAVVAVARIAWTIPDFHAESGQGMTGVALFTIATAGTHQGLNGARFTDIIAGALAIGRLATL